MPLGYPLLFALLMATTACSGATGPARRHLAAVELATRNVPPSSSEQRKSLERARDELIAGLTSSPRLHGAALSLATVLAWLGDADRALKLRPTDDDMRAEERPHWRALELWALGRTGRWTEVLADSQATPELLALATAQRDQFAASCSTSPPIDPTPTSCCAPETTDCRECLAALNGAWCAQAIDAETVLAATTHGSARPHLELARYRLRASVSSSLRRFEQALTELDAAREAALRLPGDPSATLIQTLDIDRALTLAWLGRVAESRTILTKTLAEEPPAPLLDRAKALSAALSTSADF